MAKPRRFELDVQTRLPIKTGPVFNKLRAELGLTRSEMARELILLGIEQKMNKNKERLPGGNPVANHSNAGNGAAVLDE